jgi:hypothetical protein
MRKVFLELLAHAVSHRRTSLRRDNGFGEFACRLVVEFIVACEAAKLPNTVHVISLKLTSN